MPGGIVGTPSTAVAVMPDSRASVPATKKLAVKPPAPAAYPAATPTQGLRPSALNTAPAMTGVKMMPASEARLALMPTMATTATTSARGAPRIVLRIRAEIMPVCSSRLMPNIIVMMRPRGAKLT